MTASEEQEDGLAPDAAAPDAAEAGPPILHPWQFLGLAVAFAWMIEVPAALSGVDISTTPYGWIVYLGGLGPAIAALYLLYTSDDSRFIVAYWRRLVDPSRITGWWWAMILLFPPVLTLISLAIFIAAGGGFPPFEQLSGLAAAPLSVIPFLLGVLLFGPLPEEPGWRGYGLDALQQRFNALTATMILGVIWAAWHLPLFFIEGTWQSKLGFGLNGFWWFALSIVAQTVLLTFIYNGTHRSTLAAVLFHLSINATGELLPLPEGARMVQLGLWIASAAIVAILFGVRTLSTVPPEDGLLDELKDVQEHGVCPWRAAGILMSPLRRLILSPEQLVERLDLSGDERVLELGPGPGYFTPALAEALPDGHLLLVDVQQEMLAMVRDRLEQASADHTDAVQGDATHLPFEDESFDVVLVVAVLGETPEPEDTLVEVRRVLKPGGLYSNTEQPGDPDHIPQALMRGMAEDAGFTFERTWGSGSNYTFSLRK